MYPIVILDNFFPSPDKIVDLAMEQEYFPSAGNYPGKRSKDISEIDQKLSMFIGHKLYSIFSDNSPNYWEITMNFQLIEPRHKFQYHPKNMGWIHKDSIFDFGGIIYLNKIPEENTGTSIYKEKFGYSYHPKDCIEYKSFQNKGMDVPDKEYIKKFNEINDQYEETINVQNVYNRMVMFGGDVFHGAKTFGHTQSRLTIAFFAMSNLGVRPPLFRCSY